VLSMEERRQLERIAILLREEPISSHKKKPRSRDDQGRYLPEPKPEESKSASVKPSVREIKLVRIKGSYGSFKVKTRWLTKSEKAHLYFFIGLIVLALLV
jgi:hypothetical protein